MRRYLKWGLLGLVAVLALVVIGGLIALRSPSVQQSLLQRGSRALEESFGVTLSAERSSLGPLSGHVELGQLELRRVSDSELVLAADELDLRIGVWALLRGRVEIESLRLETPVLDLAALPSLPEPTASDSPSGAGAFMLGELTIDSATILEIPLPESAAEWVDGALVSGLTLTGSIREGKLEALLEEGHLEIERRSAPPLDLVARARVVGPAAGPWEVETFELAGEGVELAATGVWSITEAQEVDFTSTLDLGSLLSWGRPAELEATGKVNVRDATGTVSLRAPAIAGEVVEGFVEAELSEKLGLAGTTLGFTGDFDLGPESLGRISGTVNGTWLRSSTELARLASSLELRDGALRIPLTLELAPALSGRYEIGASIASDGSGEPLFAEAGRIALEVSDLVEAKADLTRYWPIAADLPEVLSGALEVGGTFSGVLQSLDLALDGAWRPKEGGELRFDVGGDVAKRNGVAALELSGFPLTPFAGPDAGRLSGRLDLAGSESSWRGDFDLAVAEARLQGEPVSMRATGGLSPQGLKALEISGLWADAPLALEADATLIASGIELAVSRVGYGSLEAEANALVPGTLFEGVPLLSSRSWRTPAAGPGVVDLTWTVPYSEWSRFLSESGVRAWASSNGSLRFDPRDLQSGAGEMSFGELSIERGGVRLQAEAPVSLDLRAGVARLIETTLAGPGTRVTIAGQTTLGESESLEVRSHGEISAEWLAAFAEAEGVGSGSLRLEAALEGPLDALAGGLAIDGLGTSYVAGEDRWSAPRLELAFEPGAARIESLSVLLNEEPITAEGDLLFGDGSVALEGARADFAGLVAEASGRQTEESLRLEFEVPLADWHPALAVLGRVENEDMFETFETFQEIRAAVSGEIDWDRLNAAESRGSGEIAGLAIGVGGRRVEAREPIAWTLGEGLLALEPMALVSGDETFRMQGEARLAESWEEGSEWTTWLASVALEAEGTLLASLFSPWLAGGVADGFLDVNANVKGPLDNLNGRIRLEGPDVSVAYARPDDTGQPREPTGPSARDAPGPDDSVDAASSLGEERLLTRPRLDLIVEPGRARIESLSVVLNGEPIAAEGTVLFDDDAIEVEDGLVEIAGLSAQLAGRYSESRARLAWEVPLADWDPALLLFGLLAEGDRVRAASVGELDWDAASPLLSQGRGEISGLVVETGDKRAEASGPIVLKLESGLVELEPVTLLSGGQTFETQGSARLADEWGEGTSWIERVTDVDLAADGTLLTALLNPWLAGGAASGYLDLEFEAKGAMDDLQGRIRLDGPEASLIYVRPYATRFSQPSLEATFDGDVGRLAGRIALNEGWLDLEGGLAAGGVWQLEAKIEDVRYRLDYGLLGLFGGRLELVRGSTGAMALTGGLVVEEGVLTRNIDLDLDLISEFLAPVDLTGTEASALDAVALDIDLSTLEGVRVRNNVADLLVRWDPVRIGGSLASPVLDGRFEVDSGGRVFAFGQTVRIDQGSLDYPGVADQAAVMDLSTTSSFEDPSIADLSGADPFAGDQRDSATTDPGDQRYAAAAAGLGAFYGERVAEALFGANVSVQPILIFGEADPGARLTVTRDISPEVALAASVNLRSAEAQTYILDVHDLARLPGLNAQAFTTDNASYGTDLKQKIELGAGRSSVSDAPKIKKLRLSKGPLSRRRMKRALGLSKGDRLESGGRFAAEIELIDYLRRQGFTDAKATVRTSPVRGGVEVLVAVEPGPKSAFRFEGIGLSKGLKRSIKSLYRTDYYEPTALEEMAEETRRALRSLGYLDPVARIEADESSDSATDRIVTVWAGGERKVSIEDLRFSALSEAEAALVSLRLGHPVQRVELAAGLPAADRRLEGVLRSLGYMEGRVLGRRVSDDGSHLEVDLDLGPRAQLAAIAVDAPDLAPEPLLAVTGLEVGDPARGDRISRGAVAIREELRDRGYADARVTPRLADDRTDLVYEVEPGEKRWVGEVRVEGLRTTRPKWALAVADLPIEEDFSDDLVYAARRRLWATGLFSEVTPQVVGAPAGPVRVDFDVKERSRFEVGYGLRWDSEEAASVLVEVIDRNAIGRGTTFGLRGQWSDDDQSVRAFGGVPRLFGPRTSLKLFGLVREEVDAGLITDTFEATLQLSYTIWPTLTARVYAQYDDTRVTEEVPDLFFPLDVRVRRPLIGSQLLFDRRRGDELSPRGLFWTADLSLSEDFIGSDFHFARFFGQVNSFRRVTDGRRPLTWAQSVRVGIANAFDQELVRTDRFFAGGEFSVRGYRNESLGPLEDLVIVERPLGGEALFVLNEEIRWRLSERLSGALFFDAGNVWVDRADFGSDLRTSTGLGLRALTPLGLLRMDLAHALDAREIDPNFKVYVGFGTTF